MLGLSLAKLSWHLIIREKAPWFLATPLCKSSTKAVLISPRILINMGRQTSRWGQILPVLFTPRYRHCRCSTILPLQILFLPPKAAAVDKLTPQNVSPVTQLALLVKQTGVIKRRRSDHISALITTEESRSPTWDKTRVSRCRFMELSFKIISPAAPPTRQK